jgi:hypothetical protein
MRSDNLKIKVEPQTEINYAIESEYGWLEGKYFPDRAMEHLAEIFAHHVGLQFEIDFVERSELFEPYMKYAEALLERFARREFENALKNLVLKLEAHTLIAVEGVEPKKATERIDKLADEIKKEVKRDMDAPKRGGAREKLKRKYFTSNDELIRYAETVNGLRPLWGHITRFFSERDYDFDCLSDVKKTPSFGTLSQAYSDVPDDLLRTVFRKERPDTLSGQEKLSLSPLGLSLEHARRELGIGSFAAETLKKRYNEGKKLLREATKKN